MKKLLCVLPVLFLFIFSGCTNLGKEKIFDGVQVYHTDKVTDAEADSLGNYLVRDGFADGQAKTVQLTKSGNTYQFRMVIKEGIENDPQYASVAKFMATMLSAKLFNGAPVEMHFCDKYMKTLKVLKADDYGKEVFFDGTGVFHSKDITDSEVNTLGKYLVDSKFADGNGKSVLLTKSGNIYQFRFVVKSGIEKDPSYQKTGSIFASDLSTHVFNASPVEVIMCDSYFKPLLTVQMQ
jgi:hypothetical protein